MSINRIKAYLDPRQPSQRGCVDTKVGTQNNAIHTNSVKKGEEGKEILQKDSLEITPEATQAAKRWNEHIREIRGHGASSEALDTSIISMLTGL